MNPAVFLSYARGDDEPFVRRLYDDLRARGFEVWWDRQSLLSRQLTFHQEIKDAIRTGVDRLVYVAGPRAALSDFVREEWQVALELDKPVIPILRKGDYNTVPGGLSLLHCEDFRDDGQYTAQLAKLIRNLELPAPKLGALLGVPNLPAHFLGRPGVMRRVKDALLVDLQNPVITTSATSRVGVQGMGGIGKSVLAAALARDTEVRRSYPDGVIWVSFGKQPNLPQLQRDVTAHLGGREQFENEVQGQGVLRQLLAQRAVLLVLDDVWSARDAQAFDVLGPRCRALLTTRDAGILHTLNGEMVPVSLFTEDEALQLLADTTGVERATLPAEAREIVRECGCLALAVALCGGMVRKHGGEWSGILQRLRRADLDKIKDREAINPEHESIGRAMMASVDVLPEDERRRFVELTVFAEDVSVPAAAVATLWSHSGGLDDLDTEDLLLNLAERSLIRLDRAIGEASEEGKHLVSLHDLLRDLAGRLADEPRPLHQTLLDAYAKKCPAGWPTGPNDGYFFQRLGQHLTKAGRADELRVLLWNAAFLKVKIDTVGPQALIEDYDLALGEVGSERMAPNARDNERLRLLQGAIRLSAHVLARDSRQLGSQLYGRLSVENDDDSRALLGQLATLQREPWLRPLSSSLHPPGTALLRTLVGHSNRVMAVAVTPDGRRVVSGSLDETLKVWDLESGREERTLTGHSNTVTAVAVTPDGRRVVSGSLDETLKVWDLESGREERTLTGHSWGVNAVAVTPDGRCAVSASMDGTLKVWDLASGREGRTLEGHSWGVNAMAVTPDGRRAVSASGDKTLKVWDLGSGEEERTLAGHSMQVAAVAVTPDGRQVVSGSDDETLKVWDLASGEQERTLAGYSGYIHAVAVTPDSRRAVSAAGDGTLKVWDLESGRVERTLGGHSDVITAVAVTPNGRRAVSASWDNTLRVWDLVIEEKERTLMGQSEGVMRVAVTPDGCRAVSASWGRTLKVWELASGEVKRTLAGHSDMVMAVAVTPDGGRAVSASRDGTLKVWDLASGEAERTLTGHSGGVNAVAVTPDGRRVVSGSDDKTLKVWDLASGEMERTLAGHSSTVLAVAVTPDGRRAVSASWDKTLKVWDLGSGEVEWTLVGHSRVVYAVVVTPDGRRAVSASWDKTLKVWDLASGETERTLTGHSDVIYAVVVTQDGRLAVSASQDGTLKVWDLASGETERTLAGHSNEVLAVAVTLDGRRAVSASWDKTLKVWDLVSGSCLTMFEGDGAMLCCAVATDGRTIVAGDASGCLHFLRLEGVDSHAATVR